MKGDLECRTEIKAKSLCERDAINARLRLLRDLDQVKPLEIHQQRLIFKESNVSENKYIIIQKKLSMKRRAQARSYVANEGWWHGCRPCVEVLPP